MPKHKSNSLPVNFLPMQYMYMYVCLGRSTRHNLTQWIDVFIINSQRASLHLLKAKGQRTVGHSSGHEVAREKEGGATSGAIVVAVGNGDTSQSGVVE